ncbi:MAG: hypothetical protein ABH872_04335 [Candidatus Omnitrophota bacterium]
MHNIILKFIFIILTMPVFIYTCFPYPSQIHLEPLTDNIAFKDKDIFPPEIESIIVEASDIIILKFSEALDEESATKEENYKAITNKREIHPEKIEYRRDVIVLKFPVEFNEDEEGYIESNDIADLAGNYIASGTRSPEFSGDCGC